MVRVGAVLSVLVVVAGVALTAAALRSDNSVAGVAVLSLGLFAIVALLTIWLGLLLGWCFRTGLRRTDDDASRGS